MKLLTAEQMRALDRRAIAEGASGETLMERAGAGVAGRLERRYGDPLALRVLVLAGTGNNGGDGFVAARHLAARGADVTVGLLGDAARVKGEALVHLERMRAHGLAEHAIADETALAALVATRPQWDFALDAVLGTGARGAPEGLAAAAVQALRELDDRGVRVIALDLPTGVDADTGAVARRAVRASLTVTFGHPKRGHFLYPGRAFCGALEVVDIGLPDAGPGTCPFEVATPEGMATLVPARDPRAHKGSAGRVLLVGGSPGRTGAVALAARAATRTGAGYVQIVAPESLHDVLESKLTEEMTLPHAETAQHTLARTNTAALLERSRAVSVLAVGPGLGAGPEEGSLARALALGAEVATVVDADALNAFAGHADALATARAPLVLTPHLGEMSRLTGIPIPELEAGRLDFAREWAMTWRCVVVLKGAPTVIAAPDGRAMVSPTGNPGMATAGMGDVLTGAIAALIGQGLTPFDAARLGAFAHGLAGDLVAARQGALGLAAGDVVEAMPAALRELAALRDAGPRRG